MRSKVLGRRGVMNGALLNGGQARIGLDPDGQAASRVKPAADGNGKFNANTAVCAHSVCPGLGHRRSNGLGRGAHHGAVLVFAGVEGEGDKDGQSGGQCRINGEAGLVDFAHGLDEQGIRSRRCQRLSLRGKGGTDLGGSNFAGHEDFSRGADGSEDKSALACCAF